MTKLATLRAARKSAYDAYLNACNDYFYACDGGDDKAYDAAYETYDAAEYAYDDELNENEEEALQDLYDECAGWMGYYEES